MAVAPLIAMKSTACESMEAVGKELDRRAHTYANDVDPSRSHLNLNYCVRPEDAHPLPLELAVERRMKELNTKRKIRDNQVRAMGFIVSTNDALDDERAHAFLFESLGWFADRYGRENLLAAAEHYDEGTAHIQFWIAPVIHDAETGYDRLCAKELFAPDKTRKNPQTGKREVVAKGTMSMLQEDFWREVASKYGFEPPMPKELRQKGYRSLEAYKQHEGTTRELKAEITALRAERDGLGKAVADKGWELDEIKSEIEGESLRLEGLRRDGEEADRRIVELGERIDRAAEAAEHGAGSLAARCDGLMSDYLRASRGAEEALGECRAALVRSLKGDGVPDGAASRARAVAAGDRSRELGDRMPALRARLERLRGAVAGAVGGLARGWGLLSERAQRLRAEVSRGSGVPSTAMIREALRCREGGGLSDLEREKRDAVKAAREIAARVSGTQPAHRRGNVAR